MPYRAVPIIILPDAHEFVIGLFVSALPVFLALHNLQHASILVRAIHRGEESRPLAKVVSVADVFTTNDLNKIKIETHTTFDAQNVPT
ncbi:hypothetical protein IT41_18605 [Paracoccus halophilus]|uniref:Uncharacterized protein n=1 Tax=Paracoccus halophilus TaxID=376733 RepID=A0A099EUK3_9RHOB|nr:hypothetical protein IT41_18605 [Paracoccus halophilus]